MTKMNEETVTTTNRNYNKNLTFNETDKENEVRNKCAVVFRTKPTTACPH